MMAPVRRGFMAVTSAAEALPTNTGEATSSPFVEADHASA
jgi:hypothetical protein